MWYDFLLDLLVFLKFEYLKFDVVYFYIVV